MIRTRIASCAALIAGVLAPAVARAADVVLTYDDVQFSTSPIFTAGTTTTVTLGSDHVIAAQPAGTYFRFGIRATVLNNPNTAAAIANGNALGYPQPADLGIATFAAWITNSNSALVMPRVTGGGTSTARINSNFGLVSSPGAVDPADGSVGTGNDAFQLGGSLNPFTLDVTDPAQLARTQTGVTGTVGDDLFRSLAYQFGTSAFNAVLTPSFEDDVLVFVTTASNGNAANGSLPSYGYHYFNPATDSFTEPGPLTIVVPEPAGLATVALAALLGRRRRR